MKDFGFLESIKDFDFVQIVVILFIIVILPNLLNIFFTKRDKKGFKKSEDILLSQHKQKIAHNAEMQLIFKDFMNSNTKILNTLDIFISEVKNYNAERKEEFLVLLNKKGRFYD